MISYGSVVQKPAIQKEMVSLFITGSNLQVKKQWSARKKDVQTN